MANISTIEPVSPPRPAGGQPPSKLSQLEQLLKQGRTLLQDLRDRLERATNERDELAATLKERDAAHEKLWAEQAEIHRTDGERHARELDDVRRQLDAAMAAREAAVTQRTELESQVKELHGVRSQLEEAVAAERRLADQLREAEEHRTSLERALAVAIDDVEQLRTDADRAAALAREIFETHHK
jgi:chromosome segregation ATPase